MRTHKKHARTAQKRRLGTILSSLRGNGGNKKQRRGPQRVQEQRRPADKITFLVVAALTIFGWVMVYSGSFYVASQRVGTLFFDNNPYHFFILQGLWILIGLVGAFVLYRINLNAIKHLALPFLLTTVVLLIVVLLTPGEINGAKLWLKIGPFSLQPSEFAKLALILYLPAILSKTWYKDDPKSLINTLWSRVYPLVVIVLPIIALIFIGKDLAMAGLVGMICVSIYFFAGKGHLHNMVVSTQVLIALAAAVVVGLAADYRQSRLRTYLDFLATGEVQNKLSSGYQLNQILIAVGSGGLFGYGFGQSRQKYFYLQETAFSDTIFAVIAEELGLIGSLIVIGLFIVLFLRMLKIAQTAKSRYARLVAIGLVTWLIVQSLIHLGVNVGLFPLTGITLPFISYGGSSLITCLWGVGILLNISRDAKVD